VINDYEEDMQEKII